MEAYGALRIFLIFIHVRVYCMRVYIRVHVHIDGIQERFDIISTLGETPVPRDWRVSGFRAPEEIRLFRRPFGKMD